MKYDLPPEISVVADGPVRTVTFDRAAAPDELLTEARRLAARPPEANR